MSHSGPDLLYPNTQKSQDNFAHLHLHSVYSLLDGAIRIEDLVRHIKAQGMTSVAVTDHGNMFGAIEFYEKAIKAGIKPIIGCEFYVAPGSRFEKKSLDKLADGNAYHLVLLAKNKVGYKNLIKLASASFLEGFYRKPRIDYEILAEHTEGLVCLTACLGGEVNQHIFKQREHKAFELAGHLNEIFGQGNFFLEIQDHGMPEQHIVTKGAIDIHKKTGIPLVLTNDAHFLRRQDQKAQDIMLRIQMNKKEDEPMEFGFNEEFYVKSPAEMKRLYPEFPEAFHNTMLISDMIDFQMDFGHPLLPDFQTPNNESLRDHLKNVSVDRLQKRFNGSIPDKYSKRLDYELDVIGTMGFDGYFLIVSDFIDYAKQSNIPVGPGRGSAAGSIVAYSLGITNIDPLKYDLLFERFLNPSRNEMPDIDIDFCRDRREEVINYVVEKYGADHVSQIITFNTLSAKAVIKDVARVLGFDFADINALSKYLPDTPGLKLDDAVAASKEIEDFFKSGKKEKLLYKIAQTLEGMPRNSGKHAAGVVIAPQPMDEIIPLAKDTKTGSVISQFEKGPLEKAGLVKMDFLGLKNLTIIQTTVDEIRKRTKPNFDIDAIPLDDVASYELLQKGYTKGIFQVEKSGITSLLMRAKPSQFEDIVACIALYRPGPLQAGMTDEYVKRKNGEVKVEYLHKDLEPVLLDTFGTIVYQEQVMRISQIIGDFTMADADTLRKAMGKKKMNVMKKMKDQFVKGAEKKGYNKKLAIELFDMMAKFGEYGFNKSHSAAYGLITYQTAYLKAHYLVEFMKANLDADIETTEALIGIIHSCREMKLEILPPDINESGQFFTIIDDKTIRYGLLGLKGVGRSAVDAIIEARQTGEFKNVHDLASRVDSKHFNKKLLEALICSGALDSFGLSRAALFNGMENILSWGSRAQKDKAAGQESLFGDIVDESQTLHILELEEWEAGHKMIQEKQTLGLYLSAHPLDQYIELLSYTDITSLSETDDGTSSERELVVMGVIEKVKVINTRRGTTFTMLTVSDLSGRHEIRVYNKVFNEVRHLLKENSTVIVNVRVQVFRDNDPPTINLTANKVYPSSEINNWVQKSLHIFFPENSLALVIPKIQSVKKTLKHHKGTNPVYLHYKTNGRKQVVKVHPSLYVNYDAALDKQLSSILFDPKHFAWQIGSKLQTYEGDYKLA